jgi:ABC-type glycerol-3-phosphate transport system permease component
MYVVVWASPARCRARHVRGACHPDDSYVSTNASPVRPTTLATVATSSDGSTRFERFFSFYVWVLWSSAATCPSSGEPARADGYPRWQVLMGIVLPLLRSGIIATAVLCFVFAWKRVPHAFVLGGKAVETLPVAVPELFTWQGVKWGELAIVGIVALLPVLVVVFVLQRHIVRGLTMGAVKG